MLREIAGNATAMGPLVLLPGLRLERPADVLRARALSVDDKWTILAAWASDFHASIRARHSVTFQERWNRLRSMKSVPLSATSTPRADRAVA